VNNQETTSMQASEKGIDIGEREMTALLGFCGDTQALAQVLFKVKGKKVIACAANGRAAVEYTGENEGGEAGEFPITKSFLELCAAAAVEGSKHVPAQIVRLLIERTAIGAAVVVFKESGKEGTTLRNPDRIEPSAQLKFKDVDSLVQFDPQRPGHWYATQSKHMKPVVAIEAAANKCPITWVPAADELSPLGFMAKGEGGEWRGILRPVEVAAPGKSATNPEADDDGDDDDDQADKRQPGLFDGKANGSSTAQASGDDEGGDSGIVPDDYADRVKSQQARAEAGPDPVPPAAEPAKKARARAKNRRLATS
jgi:hypothetical protein